MLDVIREVGDELRSVEEGWREEGKRDFADLDRAERERFVRLIERAFGAIDDELSGEFARSSSFWVSQVNTYFVTPGLVDTIRVFRDRLAADDVDDDYHRALSTYFDRLYEEDLRRIRTVAEPPGFAPDVFADDYEVDSPVHRMDVVHYGLVYGWLLHDRLIGEGPDALEEEIDRIVRYDELFLEATRTELEPDELATLWRPTAQALRASNVIESHAVNGALVDERDWFEEACRRTRDLIEVVERERSDDDWGAVYELLDELVDAESVEELRDAVDGCDVDPVLREALSNHLGAVAIPVVEYLEDEDRERRDLSDREGFVSMHAFTSDGPRIRVRKRQIPIEERRWILAFLKQWYLYRYQPDVLVRSGGGGQWVRESAVDWLETAQFHLAYSGNYHVSGRTRFSFDPGDWRRILFDIFGVDAFEVDEDCRVLDMFGNVPILPLVFAVFGADVHIVDKEFVLDRTDVRSQLVLEAQRAGRHVNESDPAPVHEDAELQEFVRRSTWLPLSGQDAHPILETSVNPATIVERFLPFRTLFDRLQHGNQVVFRADAVNPTESIQFGEYDDRSFTHVLLDPPYGVGYGESFRPAEGVELATAAIREAERLLTPDGVVAMSLPKEIPGQSKWSSVWDVRWRETVKRAAETVGFDAEAIEVPDYEAGTDPATTRDIIPLSLT